MTCPYSEFTAAFSGQGVSPDLAPYPEVPTDPDMKTSSATSPTVEKAINGVLCLLRRKGVSMRKYVTIARTTASATATTSPDSPNGTVTPPNARIG